MKNNSLLKKLCCLVLLFIMLVACLQGLSACGKDDYIKKTAKKLSTYNIEAGYDTVTKIVSAVLTYEYRNNNEVVLEQLNFHLYPNAYREDAKNRLVSSSLITYAYKNGYSYGHIEIKSVKINGDAVAFEIGGNDSNILIAPLSAQLYPDETVSVEIEYETKLANIWHRLGYGNNTVNLNNWYPILCHYDKTDGWLTDPYYSVGDPFVSDIANYNVNISVDSDLIVACGADIVDKQISAETTRPCFSAMAVRDFSIIMSPAFLTETAKVGDTTITYYYFEDENHIKNLNLAFDALNYFNNTFGTYPYATLAVVQSDFYQGGMEYPRLVMVSAGQQENSYKKATVHEIAHQWWYALVGNDQVRNAWMDEGLAEMSTMMFFENYDYGIDAADNIKASKSSLNNFLDITRNYYKTIDTSINRSVNNYRNETEYAYMCYVKAMIMFDDIRQIMGNAKFIKALKDYFSTNKLCLAIPANLIQSFSNAYGSDMESLFDTYLTGKEKTI